MNRYVAGLALLAWSMAAMCADRSTLDIGGGRTIIVPVPNGFHALGNAAPDFRNALVNGTPSSSGLVEVFLNEKDLADVTAGRDLHRSRELKILDFRGELAADVDRASFQNAFAKFRTIANITPASINEQLAAVPLSPHASQVTSSNSKLVGKFLDKDDAVGAMTCSTFTGVMGATKACAALVIMYINHRVISLTVSTDLHSADDVNWARVVATSWVSQIRAANTDQ